MNKRTYRKSIPKKKEKGLHSTLTEDDPKFDFERDRALQPSPYLQKIRDKIINKIL